MTCRICRSCEGTHHLVREMMFGSRDEFRYFECAECGCLQLENPPEDLSQYYPADRYYSFESSKAEPPPANRVRRWIKRRRDAALLFRRGGLFGRLAGRRPNPGLADVQRWLAPTQVRSYGGRILDVGCGQGVTLHRLAELGFCRLTGIDPYLSADSHHPPVRILAQPLPSLAGESFDLVMFHHSFEHVPNPLEVLCQVRDLLAEQGVCLIRLPIASRGPWRTYGTDWAEIDAPRHFFLHTELSLSLLARDSGLALVHADYEAEPFSYAASEMYRRGISLYSDEQRRMLHWQEVFSPQDVERLESLARRYNVPGWAGRAAFYLSRDVTGNAGADWGHP